MLMTWVNMPAAAEQSLAQDFFKDEARFLV
jgi:hypothetical protein